LKEEEKRSSGTVATRIKGLAFKRDIARRITQLCCFLLFNAVVFGWGPWPILLPVLGTLGTPQKTVGEAFGSLQLMLYELVFPWLALASIFLTAVFLGRALCAWVCPFGFVQDLLGPIKRKHVQVSLRTHAEMINVKYGVLAVVLLISGSLAASSAMGTGRSYKEALGVFGPAPFNALSPADTLFAVLPRIVFDARYVIPVLLERGTWDVTAGILSVPLILWARLAIMALVIFLAVQVPRSWCRYFCPQGAFLALLSRFSFLGLRREPVKCTRVGCRECVDVCPMMVRILDLPWEKFSDPECIYCLKCVGACPTGALKVKFP